MMSDLQYDQMISDMRRSTLTNRRGYDFGGAMVPKSPSLVIIDNLADGIDKFERQPTAGRYAMRVRDFERKSWYRGLPLLDIGWSSWCLSYLTDDALVNFALGVNKIVGRKITLIDNKHGVDIVCAILLALGWRQIGKTKIVATAADNDCDMPSVRCVLSKI